MNKAKRYEPKQWGISEAASDFGCDHETLKKALARAGIEPAFKKGKFSTSQIVSALFGDYDAQRTRKVTAEADLLEMEKAEKRRELVPSSEFLEVAERGLQAMTATIMGLTDIPIESREKIIEQVRECGAAVVECAGSSEATPALQS